MSDDTVVEVSRRIAAPPDRIFRILADPTRHLDLDGSGMLRGATRTDVISRVGDVFSMTMYVDEIGEDQMMNFVVEYEPDRRVGWEPAPGNEVASEGGTYPIGVRAGHRWSFSLTPDGPDATVVTEIFDCTTAPEDLRETLHTGDDWIDAMTATLERLDELSGL